MQAVNQLCSHFEAYKDVPKITELREKFKGIKDMLKSHVFSDFARLILDRSSFLRLFPVQAELIKIEIVIMSLKTTIVGSKHKLERANHPFTSSNSKRNRRPTVDRM